MRLCFCFSSIWGCGWMTLISIDIMECHFVGLYGYIQGYRYPCKSLFSTMKISCGMQKAESNPGILLQNQRNEFRGSLIAILYLAFTVSGYPLILPFQLSSASIYLGKILRSIDPEWIQLFSTTHPPEPSDLACDRSQWSFEFSQSRRN